MVSKKPKKRPQKKRSVGIGYHCTVGRTISFYANERIAAMMADFGKVEEWSFESEYWRMAVDARYDFHEVLEYLKSFA